jgi:hypothetical protein
MSRIECPSEAWDRYTEGEERAHCPSDADMLAGLDAYGHLTWVVGYDNDDGDWIACFDFEVFDHPERGKLVAYHTVVNSDSGGFIDTLESAVVEADKAPFNLPDYWAGIGQEHGGWSDDDFEEASRVNEAWNAALREALSAVAHGHMA